MNTSTTIVSVLEIDQENLKLVFAKLVKKATKMGLTIPTLKFVGKHEAIKRITTDVIDGGESGSRTDSYKVELFDYEFSTIDLFKFNGWTLIANVEYAFGMVDLISPEYTYPEQYGLTYNKCEHCGCTHNSRVKSYIVKHDNDEFKQVGSTCAKDFLGVSPTMITSLSEALYEFNLIVIKAMGEEEFPKSFGNDAKKMKWLESRQCFDVQTVFSAALFAFDKTGSYVKKEYKTEITSSRYGGEYISKVKDWSGNYIRTNDGLASDDIMEEFISTNQHKFFSFDENYFNELMTYLSNLESDNVADSFISKIKSIPSSTKIRRMDFWSMICSIVNFEKSKLESLPIGQVGEKVNIKTKITEIKQGNGFYGVWTLYIMQTEDGLFVNKFGEIGMQFIENANPENDSPKVGDIVIATATIKSIEKIGTTMLGRLSTIKKPKKVKK